MINMEHTFHGFFPSIQLVYSLEYDISSKEMEINSIYNPYITASST